jgi:beta-phosphoglucomutase
MLLQGVILDMDGVLVDSEEYYLDTALRFFAEIGHPVQPEDFAPFTGAGEDTYIGGVADKYNILLNTEEVKPRIYEIYRHIATGHLKPLTGAREFITMCRGRGLKLALASSAQANYVTFNLNEIGIPARVFDALVTGSDVRKRKPDPEAFLLAAERLGVMSRNCLVVEDTVNGVAAAKAAGAQCLGITTSFTRDQLRGADWFAPNLAGTPDAVLEW